MKRSKIIIAAIFLFIAGQTFAAKSMKDNVSSWTQSSSDPSRTGGTGGLPPDGNDPTVGDTPVSDGLYVLLALAGAYMIARKRNYNKI